MNAQYRGVALLDIEKSDCPYRIEIGFKNEDIEIDLVEDSIRESIIDIISYWCSSRAITDGTPYTIQWISSNTIHITGDFYKGGFQGNLMHRKALTSGDRSFNIGLVKLFYSGYRPKTRRGKGIYRSEAIPLYIKCLYQSHLNPERVDLLLRVIRRRLDSLFTDIINTVKSM